MTSFLNKIFCSCLRIISHSGSVSTLWTLMAVNWCNLSIWFECQRFHQSCFSNFFFLGGGGSCALRWPLNPRETQELQSCNLYQWKRSGIPHKSSQTQMQSLIYEDGHINTPVGPSSPSGHFGFGDEEIKQLCRTERDTSHIKQLDQLIKGPI